MKRWYGISALVMAFVCAATALRAADSLPAQMVGPDEAAVAALKGKLDKMIPVQFLDTPLKRVVELLQRESEVTFVTMGSVQGNTVALEAKSMSIRDVLDRACLETGNDWDVDKGVIIIASRADMAIRHLETRVYDVRSLLVNLPSFFGPALDADTALDNTSHGGSASRMGGQAVADSGGGALGGGGLFRAGGGAEGAMNEERGPTRGEMIKRLTDLIEDTVGEGSDWADRGGALSSMREINGTLIVKTPSRNHAQIRKLLDQMEEMTRHMVTVEARFLVVKTGVADSMLAVGKGALILDAKAADAFLEKALKAESGSVSLGVIRTVCHDGQRVYSAADHPMIFLSGIEPVADAQGVNAGLSTVRTGVVFDFCPTQSMDGKSITLVFRSDIAPEVKLRQTDLPIAPSETGTTIRSTGTLQGQATTSAPGASGPVTGQISTDGKIIPPKSGAAVNGTVTLEMPEQDLVRFRSAVRIPDSGAVVFAASARALKTTAAPDTEVLLFIRVKAAN